IYLSGKSSLVASKEAGVNKRTLLTYLRKEGHPVRKAGAVRKEKSLKTHPHLNEAGELVKECKKCSQERPSEEYALYQTKSGVTAFGGACRDCRNADIQAKNKSKYWSDPAHRELRLSYQKEDRKKNPRKHQAWDRKKRFQMSLEDYDLLLSEQDHKCAACGSLESGTKSGVWSVDHDHGCCPSSDKKERTCGKCVRGLLCTPCNLALCF